MDKFFYCEAGFDVMPVRGLIVLKDRGTFISLIREGTPIKVNFYDDTRRVYCFPLDKWEGVRIYPKSLFVRDDDARINRWTTVRFREYGVAVVTPLAEYLRHIDELSKGIDVHDPVCLLPYSPGKWEKPTVDMYRINSELLLTELVDKEYAFTARQEKIAERIQKVKALYDDVKRGERSAAAIRLYELWQAFWQELTCN